MNENQFEQMWNVMRRHNLQLAGDTSSEYKCMICKNIVINACTAPCGCRFCLDCIKDYLIDGKRKCPGQTPFCGVEDIDFNTDIHIKRIFNERVSQLTVKCPNMGCPSPVQLNSIVDHLRMCENRSENCPYLILGCEGDKLSIDQMRDHLSLEIHPHTKLLINWIRNSQNETKSMKSEIDKLKEEVARLNKDNDELKEQTRLDKENTQKVIQYLKRKDKENTTEIQTLNNEMCALKNSNRSIKDKLKKSKEKTKEKILQLNAQVENQINQIEDLKQRRELTESKCEGIPHQSELNPEVHDKVHKISDSMNTETIETSKSIVDIREIIDESYSREFNWTIDRWFGRVTNARNGTEIVIFSESYFTHKNGFKFCLALWPASGGDTMLICFHIEMGPFDDLLRWPFDRYLEMSLINTETGLAYKTMTNRISNFYAYGALDQPKTERNDEMYLFDISLKELSRHPELTNNNEISIKLSIKSAIIDIQTK